MNKHDVLRRVHAAAGSDEGGGGGEWRERRAGSAGSVGLQISQVFTLSEVGALEGGGQRRDGILVRCSGALWRP